MLSVVVIAHCIIIIGFVLIDTCMFTVLGFSIMSSTVTDLHIEHHLWHQMPSIVVFVVIVGVSLLLTEGNSTLLNLS